MISEMGDSGTLSGAATVPPPATQQNYRQREIFLLVTTLRWEVRSYLLLAITLEISRLGNVCWWLLEVVVALSVLVVGPAVAVSM